MQEDTVHIYVEVNSKSDNPYRSKYLVYQIYI